MTIFFSSLLQKPKPVWFSRKVEVDYMDLAPTRTIWDMVSFFAVVYYFYIMAIPSACSCTRNSSRGMSVTFLRAFLWLELEEWVRRERENRMKTVGKLWQ